MTDHIKNLTARFTPKEVFYFVLVGVTIFLSAKLGQYIFFEWRTSPAVLWPPTGIALAVIWLGGYRYAIPVFLGLLCASLTGPVAYLIPGSITTPLGQTLGHITGAYLLRTLRFNGTFDTMKNVFIFFGVIIFACMVAPTITTAVSLLTGNLTTSPYISWSRAWAGYVFSCLILTPLILSWVKADSYYRNRAVGEVGIVSVLLFISVYFLFWTRMGGEYSFLLFALFFLAHFWVAFRLTTRMVTLSILVTTVIGMLGLFISPDPEKALNTQVFAAELFLFLVVPIFYAFSALVKERANTINDLKLAMERIEKESILKNEFIAILAHELRNPLAPVKTTLEILGLQDLEPDTKRLISSAHQQVHSMRRLLDDLLDITRVTQGKFQLQIEKVDLCKLISQCVDSTKGIFMERDHTLVVDPPCEGPLWVCVDPVRFEQILVNLFNNAAKYTNPGGTIVLSHRVRGSFVDISIKDNGLGIDAENLEDIFKPFWQMKNMATSPGGGIGVGLSLTKYITEMHGGSISAKSDGEGKGSEFIVSFPLPTPEQNREYQKKETEKATPSPVTIVVVDDNRAAADSMKKLLELKGHTSHAVYSGNEIIDIIDTLSPEVILLDIGLPDISGYEVAERLRAGGYTGTLVALTGYGQAEDKERAFSAGCDHHFIKPIAIEKLQAYLAILERN